MRCLELIESLNCKDNCYGDKYYHKECFEPFLMKSYNNAMGEIKKQLDKSTNSKDLFDDNYIDKINWASDKLIELTGKYKTIGQIKAQIADIVSSENPGTQVDKLNELTDKLAKLNEETKLNNKPTDQIIETIKPNPVINKISNQIIDWGSQGK